MKNRSLRGSPKSQISTSVRSRLFRGILSWQGTCCAPAKSRLERGFHAHGELHYRFTGGLATILSSCRHTYSHRDDGKTQCRAQRKPKHDQQAFACQQYSHLGGTLWPPSLSIANFGDGHQSLHGILNVFRLQIVMLDGNAALRRHASCSCAIR